MHGFLKLKMHQNPFSAGALPRTPLGELTSYDAPPNLLVGWAGGHPSPIFLSLDALGWASRSRRLRRLASDPEASDPPSSRAHALELGGSSVIDSLPARFDHASQYRPRLGRSALLDFVHRDIFARNV